MCAEICSSIARAPRGNMTSTTPRGAFAALAASAALALGAYLYMRRRRLAAAASTKAAAPPATTKQCKTLLPPTFSKAFNIEYSIHKPSRLLRTEIELVFRPDIEAAYQSDPRGAAAGVDKDTFISTCLFAIPTWQPASQDLSEISPVVNEERRKRLVNFDAWAKPVRERLVPKYWADCSCPMEGTARYGKPTSTIYNELEGLTQLLHYDAIPIGCCGIVLHPKWHRNAYPVTFFSTAPLDELIKVFAAVDREGPDPNAGANMLKASCM